jgi:hypothetical protein
MTERFSIFYINILKIILRLLVIQALIFLQY